MPSEGGWGREFFIQYVFIAREGKGKVKIEKWVRHSTRSLMTTWVLGKLGKKGYAMHALKH